jgi:uncharacterized protein
VDLPRGVATTGGPGYDEGVATTAPSPTTWRIERSLVLVVVLLAAYNLVGNLLVPGWAYVPTNLAMAGLLLLIAVRSGVSRAELGLDPAEVRSGLVVGGAVAVVVVIALVVGAAVPATRELYDDDRIRVGVGGLAMQVAFAIPFGTVVLEELAFRGVLLALLMRRLEVRGAVLASSAGFGLWHIAPTVPAATGNQVVNDTAGAGVGLVVVVVGAVIATTIAGVVFCWLRLRSDSLAAPMVVHLSTNSGSFLVGWLVIEAPSSVG